MAQVEETRQLLEEKLASTGALGKIKAAVMAEGLQALNDEAQADAGEGEPNGLFYVSKALKSAKQDQIVTFKVIADWLQDLGLSYTLNVMLLEASLKKQDILSLDRKKLVSECEKSVAGVNVGKLSAEMNVLSQLMKGGFGGSAITAAAGSTTTTTTTPATTVTAVVPAAVTTAPAPVAKPAAKFSFLTQPEDTTYRIANYSDRSFVRFDQCDGQQCNLDGLKKCKVYVFDALDSMQIDYCEDCEIVVSACEGSIFVRNCKNLQLTIACKQLRTRDCQNCHFRIFAGTDPVVEQSTEMHFYPFNLRAPKLLAKFKASRLDAKSNRFIHVYDFTPGAGKKNFVVHFPDHGGIRMEGKGEELGLPLEAPPEFEELLEGKLAPAASSESGSNKSLDIKTGANAWKAHANSEEEPVAVTKPAAIPNVTAAMAPAQVAPAVNLATKVPPLGLGSLASTTATAAAVPAAKPSMTASKHDDSDYDSFSDDSTASSKDKKEEKTDSDDDTF